MNVKKKSNEDRRRNELIEREKYKQKFIPVKI